MRFDGVNSGEWCGFFTSWNRQTPGTLRINKLKSASPAGARLLETWRLSPPSKPQTLLIEQRNRAKIPVARWKVTGAKPVRWQMGSSASKNEVAIESLEIAHVGISRF